MNRCLIANSVHLQKSLDCDTLRIDQLYSERIGNVTELLRPIGGSEREREKQQVGNKKHSKTKGEQLRG
jgi:hypothetical protein